MRMKWATVTSVGPLRVKLDGDTTPLPFEPDSLVDPAYLTVNDRVRCELADRRVVIVGRSQGMPVGDASLPSRLRAVNNLGSGNNPDNLTDTGWYSGFGWVGSLAGQSIGALQVINYSPDWIVQYFTEIGNSTDIPKVLVRSRHSGTTWAPWLRLALAGARGTPYAHAEGKVAVPLLAVNTSATGSVTFPAGRFSAAPNVVVASYTTRYTPQVTEGSVTATGFSFGVSNFSNADSLAASFIGWSATQMTAASGVG